LSLRICYWKWKVCSRVLLLGLSLSFESHLALIFTLVTNLLLHGWILLINASQVHPEHQGPFKHTQPFEWRITIWRSGDFFTFFFSEKKRKHWLLLLITDVLKWLFSGDFKHGWFHLRDSKKWSHYDKHLLATVCSTAVANSSKAPSSRQILSLRWILHL